MMSSMSDAKGNGRSSSSLKDGGVLVNLPHTRPQRASARRDAARQTAARAAPRRKAPARSNGRPATPTARKRAGSAAARAGASTRVPEPAPRQGFESETESMSGSVRPPGGAEFVASAAEIVGELAKAGLSTGERLLKDALSRLPGP
jgi:hypothetical protein